MYRGYNYAVVNAVLIGDMGALKGVLVGRKFRESPCLERTLFKNKKIDPVYSSVYLG